MATLHGKPSDVILDGSQKPKTVYTRDNVVSRGFSPIIGDPSMLPPQTSDPLSRQEIEQLNAANIRIDDKALGAGQHAIIYSGHYPKKDTQQTVHCAVKRSFNHRQAFAEWETLMMFGQRMTHKNIISYYGFHRTDNRMYLFIELSKMGDLSHYLSSEYGSKGIEEDDMFHLFAQICDGLTHIHNNGYAHRDIKIHNVLVFHTDSSNDGSKVVCKLCDFGSTRRYNSGDVSRTVIGSPKTMAPEVSDTPYNAFIADVYSLGVILYQLSHDGNYPFESQETHNHSNAPQVVENYAKHKRNPRNIKWSHSLTQPLKELLVKMLEPDPNRRMHLKAVYQSSWMSQSRSVGSHKHHENTDANESSKGGSDNARTEEGSPSESSPESGSESSSGSAEAKGGRYRSHRSDRTESAKSGDSRSGSESSSDYTVRSDSTGKSKGSEPKKQTNLKLESKPFMSGRESKRRDPTDFFKK